MYPCLTVVSTVNHCIYAQQQLGLLSNRGVNSEPLYLCTTTIVFTLIDVSSSVRGKEDGIVFGQYKRI